MRYFHNFSCPKLKHAASVYTIDPICDHVSLYCITAIDLSIVVPFTVHVYFQTRAHWINFQKAVYIMCVPVCECVGIYGHKYSRAFTARMIHFVLNGVYIVPQSTHINRPISVVFLLHYPLEVEKYKHTHTHFVRVAKCKMWLWKQIA